VLGHQTLVDEALLEAAARGPPAHGAGDLSQVGARPHGLLPRLRETELQACPAPQVRGRADQQVAPVAVHELRDAGAARDPGERVAELA
jgi:hypothetical protein